MGWNKRFEFFRHDPVPAWEKNEYFDFYKELIQIRHDNPALASNGSFELVSAEDSTLVFKRSLADNEVTVKVQLKAPWAYEISAK
jgi:glycosidase